MTNRLYYSEMLRYDTLLDRYKYLRLNGRVGDDTFGHDRYLNQRFYQSREWKQIRNAVISRDEANDLALPDHLILGSVYVHHLNPLTPDEIVHGGEALFDMENLVCVSHATHNAIHYGDESLLPQPIVERRPGDTTLW